MARATKNLYEAYANYISEYTQENLHQDVVIDDLVAKVGISRFHLNRLFQATTGFQLGEFIQRRRMQRAYALLASGETVTATSLAVGYESHSAFSRAFSKAFQCKPSEVKVGTEVIWKTPNTLKGIGQRDKNLQPEIIQLPTRVFYGHYGSGFSDNSFVSLAKDLTQQLKASLQDIHLTRFPSIPIGVTLESPWLGDQSQSRFFMGVAAEGLASASDMDLYLWKAGTWAKFYHCGPHQLLWQTISRVYASWVIPDSIALRDDNIVQMYCNDPANTPPEQLKTELYFPVDI